MMPCEKEKFPYSFLNDMNSLPQNFYIFTIPLSLNVTLFSKSPYVTAHIKINYKTGCIGRFSKNTKMYSGPFRQPIRSFLWH